MHPQVNQILLDTLKLDSPAQHDEFVLFEKDPYKMMVLKELEKSKTLKELNTDVSLITNLQNLKQGLKANYTDSEVLNMILLNLSFTD